MPVREYLSVQRGFMCSVASLELSPTNLTALFLTKKSREGAGAKAEGEAEGEEEGEEPVKKTSKNVRKKGEVEEMSP